MVSIFAVACLYLDLLLGDVLLDLRAVELADHVPLLDLGALGDEVADLVLAAVELADAVHGDLALDVAALADRDAERGLLGDRHQGFVGGARARPGGQDAEIADPADDAHAREQTQQPARDPGKPRAARAGRRGWEWRGEQGRLVRAGVERRAGSGGRGFRALLRWQSIRRG